MFYAERTLFPTRAPSPRQLPTDHDCAVPTRGYQSDQPSHSPLVSSPELSLAAAYRFITTRQYVKLDRVAPYQNTKRSPS